MKRLNPHYTLASKSDSAKEVWNAIKGAFVDSRVPLKGNNTELSSFPSLVKISINGKIYQ